MFTRTIARVSAVFLLLAMLIASLSIQSSVAAPAAPSDETRAAAQNVDWMTADQAASLGLDFTVLVPSWVPAPFGGGPSVEAGGGYYSLYWMIPGGDPTFLQVTGEVGGALPAGSPADLNQQLSVNASVQGYDAIHDVTSIYDNVWWVAGGVLYTVSSKNMTGTDSLSLANSLIALEAPAAQEPAPEPTSPPAQQEAPGPTGSVDNIGSVESGGEVSLQVWPSAVGTLRATDGAFSASGASFITDLTGGAVSWQAPSVSSETTVEFTLLDAQTGEVTAWSSIVVYPTASGSTSATDTTGGGSQTTTQPASNSTSAETTTDGGAGGSSEPSTSSDGTGGGDAPTATQTPEAGGTNGSVASDGTAGPEIPRKGDGTGGSREVYVP